jgi:hypothetical protein
LQERFAFVFAGEPPRERIAQPINTNAIAAAGASFIPVSGIREGQHRSKAIRQDIDKVPDLNSSHSLIMDNEIKEVAAEMGAFFRAHRTQGSRPFRAPSDGVKAALNQGINWPPSNRASQR